MLFELNCRQVRLINQSPEHSAGDVERWNQDFLEAAEEFRKHLTELYSDG